MIIYIPRDTARLAFTLRESASGRSRRVASWEGLALYVRRHEPCECGCPGSPWILTGCWPGKPTGVDIANPLLYPHDFPTIRIPAVGLDDDGRVEFVLTHELDHLPNGRYEGAIVFETRELIERHPWEHVKDLPKAPTVLTVMPPLPKHVVIPPEYRTEYNDCSCAMHTEVHRPPHRPHPCVLLTFDIDLGPECSDHFAEQIVITGMAVPCPECGESLP